MRITEYFPPEATVSELTDLLQFLAIICVPIATLVIGIPVGRALAAQLRRPSPDLEAETTERMLALSAHLERLQSSIDAIAIEMERNGEIQRYAARLLELRTSIALPEASAASRPGTITPH